MQGEGSCTMTHPAHGLGCAHTGYALQDTLWQRQVAAASAACLPDTDRPQMHAVLTVISAIRACISIPRHRWVSRRAPRPSL